MFIKTTIALAVIVSTVAGAFAAERHRRFDPSWEAYDSRNTYYGREWGSQGWPRHGMCGCAE
jgi:hypothetical protein